MNKNNNDYQVTFDMFENDNNGPVYDEYNEDTCYEFGGSSEDRKNIKSKKSSFTENLIGLLIAIAFIGGVFYYAFNCL